MSSDVDVLPFDVALDGTPLERGDTLHHSTYGALTVAQRSYCGAHTHVQFRVETADDLLYVEWTDDELHEQWGDSLFESPSAAEGET